MRSFAQRRGLGLPSTHSCGGRGACERPAENERKLPLSSLLTFIRLKTKTVRERTRKWKKNLTVAKGHQTWHCI